MKWLIDLWQRLEKARRDEWRHVPPPEWKAKRGGVELW